MRGFTPKNARKHLADGGAVFGARGLEGLRNIIPAVQAMGFQQGGAAPTARGFAPAADAPAFGGRGLAGLKAMAPQLQAMGYADGGMVRGPGTGTSDDIPADLPEGSYIMPADSTAQIGEQALDGMGRGARGFAPGRGKKVPVQISNGEYNLTPDQVHAVGVQALDGMKDATHRPARGFTPRAKAAPEEPRQFFAGGGVVEEERKPGGMAGFVADAFPGTTAAVKGSMQDAKDAYQQGGLGAAVGQSARVAATPLIGLADDVASSAARALDPAANALKTFVTGDNTPIGQQAGGTSAPPAPRPAAAPAAPVASAAPVSAPMAIKSSMPAGSTTAAPPAAPGATEVAPGIYRSGNSYGDSAQAASAGPAATGRPTAQNDQAAANLSARGFQPGWQPTAAENPTRGFTPGVVAPVARTADNDWAARQRLRNLEVSASSITNNGGRFDQTKGNNPAQAAYRAAVATDEALRAGQPASETAAMNANAAIQREGVQQAGANERAARGFQVDMGRLAIEGRRAGTEERRAADESTVRGFQTRAALQQEQLRNTLIDPNATPAQRQQAQAALNSLNGKGDSWKPVALQGGTDAQGNKTESILGAVNERTGEMKRMDAGQGGGPKAAPQEASQRQIGATYTLPNGKTGRWTEKGWLLVG